MPTDVETIIERLGPREVIAQAVEYDETSCVLATLPDGLRVISVVIEDLPFARHLYRVTGPNGAVICEHATLCGVADFLIQHNGGVLEPADLEPDAGHTKTVLIRRSPSSLTGMATSARALACAGGRR